MKTLKQLNEKIEKRNKAISGAFDASAQVKRSPNSPKAQTFVPADQELPSPKVKERKTRRDASVEDAFAERPASKKDETIRLNKFIAMSGTCSRRDADQLILDGKVLVDGQKITEPGTQVKPTAVITVAGDVLAPEPLAYLLLHKPKNTITTVSDDKGRATVTEIIRKASPLRLFPVGRLDRNTSGLLLFTNDGELSNRLLHPRYKVEKVYKFDVAAPLSPEKEKMLTSGIRLEDGPAKAYFVQPMDDTRKSFKIGVHEGRNHLIRRMIDALGAKILRLKRTDFANMKLGDLLPGEWKYLTEEEVNKLRKMVELPPVKMKA